jgi:rubrerythrin
MEVMTIESILDFAIEHEHRAIAYYANMAGRMESDLLRNVFEALCGEERTHVQLLEGMRERGGPMANTSIDVQDATRDSPAGVELAVESALELAARREKQAFKLYYRLSQSAPDATSRGIFLDLARQEACHRLQLELAIESLV